MDLAFGARAASTEWLEILPTHVTTDGGIHFNIRTCGRYFPSVTDSDLRDSILNSKDYFEAKHRADQRKCEDSTDR